jgi:tRNA-2-methylthio-N6-dimethylallyladenosine synthase
MTSHPKDASDALFEAMAANPKICKHLHLPVQSGSDRVLKAMNRRYTAEHYISLIKKARALIPDLVVTSDIIVGFPGETEEDFEETLDLLREIRFDSLFTFIYSVRRGTRAATMEGKIDEKTAHARFARLVALQNAVSRAENEALVGKTLRLLVTGKSETDPAVLAARSEGNRLCHLKADLSLIGKFVNAEIISAKTWSLEASVRP